MSVHVKGIMFQDFIGFNGAGKAKLAILALLSCGEFVKTLVQNWNSNIAEKCLSVPLELDLSKI